MQKPHIVLLTQEGLEKLEKEEKELISDRPIVLAELTRAREMGDLSENGAYRAAKMRIGQIDARLRYLHRTIIHAKIIEKRATNIVGLGNMIVFQTPNGKKEYMLVGQEEANPSEGRISNKSPLGKLLF